MTDLPTETPETPQNPPAPQAPHAPQAPNTVDDSADYRMVNMDPNPSRVPNRKVTAGGLAAALTTLIVWIVNSIVGVSVSGEAAAALVTILSFAVAYMVRSAPGDV